MRHRLGIFTIASDWLDKHPEEVLECFAAHGILPVRAEMLFHSREIEYIAVAKSFDELTPYATPPRYELVVIRGESDQIIRSKIVRP